MLDVGPARTDRAPTNTDVDEIGVFVDRIAGEGSDRPTAAAAKEIHRRIDAGATPPGLRKLAEALAASVAVPPAPRQPADEPTSVVAAMQIHNLIVLEGYDTKDVAAAVAALIVDGRRIAVTGAVAAELNAVRTALPAEVTNRVVERPPAIPPAELRELRRLLGTGTPGRRTRRDQQLPAPDRLPSAAEVADLCTLADSATPPDPSLIAELLDDLDPVRRDALTSVAEWVLRSVDSLSQYETWAWQLLDHLIYMRNRNPFDQLRQETTQAAEAVAALKGTEPVSFIEPLTDERVELLFRYLDHLDSGGRPRAYLRPVVQRDALPVLGAIRVGERIPEAAADVRLILLHREIQERMARVEDGCAELGIPTPSADELDVLVEGFAAASAAARAIGALRHDVLFLSPGSPLAVPDVPSAEEIATEIVEFDARCPAVEAQRRIDGLITELAALAPVRCTAPEHELAVLALRERDPNRYAAAYDALGAARREQHDDARQVELLDKLAKIAPELAAAWSDPDDPAPGLGMASFTPVNGLLAELPDADSTDVVVVLGAATLGVQRLLLAAAAPRLIAVAGAGGRTETTPGLLTVLGRAAALVIRGEASPAGPRPSRPAAKGNRRVSTPRRVQAGGQSRQS